MRVARRSSRPKELVRISPLQFSLSVSVVVILLGGAGLAGYYYGQKNTIRKMNSAEVAQKEVPDEAGPKEGTSTTQTPVTFYSTLTKPRGDAPSEGVRKPLRKDKVKSPPPEPTPETGLRETLVEGKGLILQVASYQAEPAARKLLDDLMSEGYRGTVLRADLGERGTWFRVRIGPYNSEKEARVVLEKLRKERSLRGYIVK